MAEISDGLSTTSRVVEAYLDDLRRELTYADQQSIQRLLRRLESAMHSGRRIFMAGNGGSATTASHIALDLSAAISAGAGRASSSVHSLTDNVGRLSAIANDLGYDRVFAHQLRALGRPGDVFLALSVSGESANLLAAASAAGLIGMRVLALTGQPSRLADMSDCAVIVGGRDYGLCEDIHLAIGHMAVRLLRGVRQFTCTSSPYATSGPIGTDSARPMGFPPLTEGSPPRADRESCWTAESEVS